MLLGFSGLDPVTCDPAQIHPHIALIRASGQLPLDGGRMLPFRYEADLQFHRAITLPEHPNGLRFAATFVDGSTHAETFYSVGGGFVVRAGDGPGRPPPERRPADADRDLERPRRLLPGCRV